MTKRPLVGLTDRYGALPTSSGLAAAPDSRQALERATQEIIERDAFMSVWLHALAPPFAPLPPSLLEPITATSPASRSGCRK